MSLEKGEGFVEGEFKCPACKRNVALGKIKHPDSGKIERTIMHALPACNKFLKTTAEEFADFVMEKGLSS